MTRHPLLGSAGQLGFVVRDIEAAMNHWVDTFGVGPFLYLEKGPSQPVGATLYLGKTVHVETRLAFGFIGDLEIELIEQVNDAPSPYRESLAAGREGLHHLGFWVNDHRQACLNAEAAGYDPVYKIPVAGGHGDITYFAAPTHIGPFVEIIPPIYRRARDAVFNCVTSAAARERMIRYETYGDFLRDADVLFE